MARSSSLNIVLLFAAWLTLPAPARAFDVILDPRIVNQMLAEIGKSYEQSKNAPKASDRLNALYALGETSLDLADLMSKDKSAPGNIDPSLGGVIQRRLKPYGVNIFEDKIGYPHHLAPVQEDLRLSPAVGARPACR